MSRRLRGAHTEFSAGCTDTRVERTDVVGYNGLNIVLLQRSQYF